MKALLQPHYGNADSLVLDDIEHPAISAKEVLIRVVDASLNFGDKMTLLGRPKLFRPFVYGPLHPHSQVLGMAVAGVVVEVGELVTELAVGDEVFGTLKGGSCAEYAVGVPERLVRKPAGISFEQAAAIPIAGPTALQGLRDAARVKPGDRVLINGASGGVGTFAIQIAKAMGARVTAVCSGDNIDQAYAIGADEVIDYTAQNYTDHGPDFDVVFDLVGNHTLAERRSVLRPTGVYVASFGQGGGEWLGPLGRILSVAVATGQPRTVVLSEELRQSDLLEVAHMVEAGQVRPVIDRTYPLEQAKDAVRYMLAGHARGKVLIEV